MSITKKSSKIQMTSKSITLFIIVLFVSVLCVSCFDDGAAQPIDSLPSTFEIVESSEEHVQFYQLLRQFDLDTVLNSRTHTVFAPIDFAFANVNLANFSEDELRNIVKNHIVVGNAESANLSNTYLQSLATTPYEGDVFNLSLLVSQAADIRLNGVSELLLPDVLANNGVVHYVDQLITTPSLGDFITHDPDLTSLLMEIQNLEGEEFNFLFEASSENTPYTLFAPNNQAFFDVLIDLAPIEIENLNQLTTETLINLLNYHIIENEALRAFNLEAGNLETRAGEIQVLLNDLRLRDVNGRTVEFEFINIQATNGVMHKISQVILPDLDLPEIIPTFLEVAQEEGFSIFAEAINLIQGYENTLVNTPELTVFAPTNTAFNEAFTNVGATNLDGFLTALGGVEDLQNVLNYHMVNAVVNLDNFTGPETLVTRLNTQEITLITSGNFIQIQDVNGNTYNVSTQNLTTSNGLLHAIEGLLIPQL